MDNRAKVSRLLCRVFFDERAAGFHIRDDAVDALREVRMHEERKDGDAEAERGRDERLTDAPVMAEACADWTLNTLKAEIMPLIVPRRPRSGAIVTMTDR